ncbi:MAG: NAD-dependent epimerase/dehydratase family protein [Gammaproteobacteria bacterium]|nr:NAD-dependent epimerase/dehydratase family protein [Gammaproteobacteria bacterium]
MRTLVIGGTGPTGPYIINGLLERGHDVTMLNRGSRDLREIPPSVSRIKADPHFAETLAPALEGKQFDLVVATYGRLRVVAEQLVGKTGRVVAVGGAPGYRGFAAPESRTPAGIPIPTGENADRVETIEENKPGFLIRRTEDALMAHHEAGDFNATLFRYPVVYGPRQIRPRMWWVIDRIQQGRKHMVLPDGGMAVQTRGYAENMAHAVLLGVDHPEASAGQFYNCGDDEQLTLSGWVQTIAACMSSDLEIISVPDSHASVARELIPMAGPALHMLLDTAKVRTELGYRDRVPAREAMQRTVAWVLENPPDHSDDDRAFLQAQFKLEDEMATVYREFCAKLETLAPVTREFAHSYAHPTKPGERDHRGR